MSPPDPLHDPVSALVEAAHEFHRTAGTPGSHTAAPDSLAALQEALQALSAAWYRLGADAARGFEHDRGGRLSREQEVRLIGGLHDVAAAFARCARACREGGATVAPVIARQLDVDGSWFARPATERGTVLK